VSTGDNQNPRVYSGSIKSLTVRSTAAKQQRIRITLTTSRQVIDALEALVSLGLYGSTVAEAAERMVCEGLRNDLKRKRAKAIENGG
jgi:hypothetical protein